MMSRAARRQQALPAARLVLLRSRHLELDLLDLFEDPLFAGAEAGEKHLSFAQQNCGGCFLGNQHVYVAPAAAREQWVSHHLLRCERKMGPAPTMSTETARSVRDFTQQIEVGYRYHF